MSDNQLFKASSLMAVGTIASRVTGLIRNLMLAALLGTAILGDTYNVANTMPNILYNLLVGGCLLYTSPSPRDRQKSRMPSSA